MPTSPGCAGRRRWPSYRKPNGRRGRNFGATLPPRWPAPRPGKPPRKNQRRFNTTPSESRSEQTEELSQKTAPSRRAETALSVEAESGVEKSPRSRPAANAIRHRPGQARALGLRAGIGGVPIVSQTSSRKENQHVVLFLAAK